MGLFPKAQRFIVLIACVAFGAMLVNSKPAQAAQQFTSVPDVSGEAFRMVFKENTKNKNELSCQLTLMHVYTSKFNKKFTQFAFTGSVVAKRELSKPMVLSVIGQNHQLAPGGKGVQLFVLPHIELSVEDANVRRFHEHKSACKKGQVCAQYKDTKKRELQTWMSDDIKSLYLLFPLAVKQPLVVIDLSKLGSSGKAGEPPLAQFKACVEKLR